jgi:hypothetical protein
VTICDNWGNGCLLWQHPLDGVPIWLEFICGRLHVILLAPKCWHNSVNIGAIDRFCNDNAWTMLAQFRPTQKNQSTLPVLPVCSLDIFPHSSRVYLQLAILYHFDRVFRILEIYLPEKAEKFSFGLWRFLKQSFFSAVTRDWTPGRNDTVIHCRQDDIRRKYTSARHWRLKRLLLG